MTPDRPSLLAFRLRILAALGLGTTLTHLPASSVSAGTTSGGQVGTSSSTTGGSDTDAESSSSSTGTGVEETSGTSTGRGESSSSGGGEMGGTSGGSDSFEDCSGCYGRPYVVEGRARAAPLSSDAPWGTQRSQVAANLSSRQREALAEFWLDAARAEHSSIAGFLRFGLELMALGAPESLLMQAQRASMQEREHARACFEMAALYGVAAGPGPLDLGEAAPLAGSLEAFAEATVREGCVGETVAAWLARTLAEQSNDPRAATVLRKIADEEEEHAALAWASLRWAIDTGGDRVREAAARAFAEATVRAPAPPVPAVPSHGLIDGRTTEAVMQAAMREIVNPCAAEVLAA